jgi:hypothetical protein
MRLSWVTIRIVAPFSLASDYAALVTRASDADQACNRRCGAAYPLVEDPTGEAPAAGYTQRGGTATDDAS